MSRSRVLVGAETGVYVVALVDGPNSIDDRLAEDDQVSRTGASTRRWGILRRRADRSGESRPRARTRAAGPSRHAVNAVTG